MRWGTVISITLVVLILVACAGALAYWVWRRDVGNKPLQQNAPTENFSPPIQMSDGFDYPVGRAGRVTQASDGDGWYNAQDFGRNNHLGEDWNDERGGGSDCGAPVYAASKGTIVLAADAVPAWGKVLIIRHKLSDGTLVETLYGHLQSFNKTGEEVDRSELIGRIGDADGLYPCHLHFELRLPDCPFWGEVGPGYSTNGVGWTDPSAYIDAHRKLGR